MKTKLIHHACRFAMPGIALLICSVKGVSSERSLILKACDTTNTYFSDYSLRKGDNDTNSSGGKKINLNEITVSSSYVTGIRSPLRIQTVNEKMLQKKPAGITYPELIGNIPGIYATSESGSYGDARINIRGFKQENISVLLNGIPISGLTSGNMFWNNWLGLTDATHSIQVQKGIGASMLSDNSVGGTVNIITRPVGEEPAYSAGISATSYGLIRTFADYNSGKLRHGWAFSLMASYSGGKGYIDASDVSSWAYMLNISKQINNRHSLLLTLLGSPERHEQRSARLTPAETDLYGIKYNKNWGYRDGKKFNLSRNFYHKPYITLNHFGQLSENWKWNNTAYLSIGDGGGRWSESKEKRILSYIKQGQIDWGQIIAENKEAAADGKSSKNILSDFLAGHTQAGIKSEVLWHPEASTSVTFGAHYQYYYTWEKEKITDLLGGQFWEEEYAKNSLAGLSERNPMKKEGDYIRTDNGRYVHHGTVYTQAEYNTANWNFRGGISLMGATFQRWDKYNYTGKDYKSEVEKGYGFSAKAGALYKITRGTSLYANAAYYSRLPYWGVYFASGTNTPNKEVANEQNYLFETGHRYTGNRFSAEWNIYYAYWKNKSLMSNPYKQMDDVTSQFMVQGLDAIHYGAELNMELRATPQLTFSGSASLGHWKWNNDVQATFYDNYSGKVLGEYAVYTDGLWVGDAPQTQFSAAAEWEVTRDFSLRADWTYNGRLYADFNPADRRDSKDRGNSLKLPDYSLLNAGFSWKTHIGKTAVTLHGNINNILNRKFIERGKDGKGHTMDTFSGFWGTGINGSLGVRINL